MKISFYAAETDEAIQAKDRLSERYGHTPLNKADVIVVLGGDGTLLHALHEDFERCCPVFGMNRGSVGFLLNEYEEDGLIERLENARPVTLHPLHMQAETVSGETVDALAVNEISLLRETHQAAKLQIMIDGVERMDELICDGILVSTPAGSTAYNLSAYGPIIPLNANILALTPISAFRPRRWRGALLPHDCRIEFNVLESDKRPVSAVADFIEVRDVKKVTIREDRNRALTLLFDPDQDLDERIRKEQFMP